VVTAASFREKGEGEGKHTRLRGKGGRSSSKVVKSRARQGKWQLNRKNDSYFLGEM